MHDALRVAAGVADGLRLRQFGRLVSNVERHLGLVLLGAVRAAEVERHFVNEQVFAGDDFQRHGGLGGDVDG